jgi:hypothetical protein
MHHIAIDIAGDLSSKSTQTARKICRIVYPSIIQGDMIEIHATHGIILKILGDKKSDNVVGIENHIIEENHIIKFLLGKWLDDAVANFRHKSVKNKTKIGKISDVITVFLLGRDLGANVSLFAMMAFFQLLFDAKHSACVISLGMHQEFWGSNRWSHSHKRREIPPHHLLELT